MSDDFFSSPAGRSYLNEEYCIKQRSTHELAAERNTYPNRIRRALKAFGFTLRTKAEAQKAALKTGRHPHPTKGGEQSPETRQKISESIRAHNAKKDNDGQKVDQAAGL